MRMCVVFLCVCICLYRGCICICGYAQYARKNENLYMPLENEHVKSPHFNHISD